MKRSMLLFVLVVLFSISLNESARAQTRVTFNIDLSSQMEDSLFVPDRGDIVELTGDLPPLSQGLNLRMRDLEPVDSVFTVTVSFSRANQGETLFYNYILRVDDQTNTETSPRRIPLRGGQIETDPAFFDTFAI